MVLRRNSGSKGECLKVASASSGPFVRQGRCVHACMLADRKRCPDAEQMQSVPVQGKGHGSILLRFFGSARQRCKWTSPKTRDVERGIGQPTMERGSWRL